MLKSYEATLNNNQIIWLAEQPNVVNARILVTILEEPKLDKKRQPPASIAGIGQTLGDIVNPIVDLEDWQCIK